MTLFVSVELVPKIGLDADRPLHCLPHLLHLAFSIRLSPAAARVVEVRNHHAAGGPAFPPRMLEGQVLRVVGVRRYQGNTDSVVLVHSYTEAPEVETAPLPHGGTVQEEIELNMPWSAQLLEHQAARADYPGVVGDGQIDYAVDAEIEIQQSVVVGGADAAIRCHELRMSAAYCFELNARKPALNHARHYSPPRTTIQRLHRALRWSMD